MAVPQSRDHRHFATWDFRSLGEGRRARRKSVAEAEECADLATKRNAGALRGWPVDLESKRGANQPASHDLAGEA